MSENFRLPNELLLVVYFRSWRNHWRPKLWHDHKEWHTSKPAEQDRDLKGTDHLPRQPPPLQLHPQVQLHFHLFWTRPRSMRRHLR
jgi:hypothetical protein